MKLPKKAIKAASYGAGILAIASAGLLAILLLLSIVGLIHPRTTQITLFTEDSLKVYDGTPLRCSDQIRIGGSLHRGHRLVIREYPEITLVGSIPNAPIYQIVDETGADVTKQYDILEQFGTLSVQPRSVTLYTTDKYQYYDGTPLSADKPVLLDGVLAPEHQLILYGPTTITAPGTVQNQYSFRIEDANGADLTDQYKVVERFGTLNMLRIPLYISTNSAQKVYDGTPLQADGWKLSQDLLMEGHTLSVVNTTSIQNVGVCQNTATVTVADASGADVSSFYNIQVAPGLLEIFPIQLVVATGSAEKVYDGTPITCADWSLLSGDLRNGDTLELSELYAHKGIGSTENFSHFRIVDSNGADVSQYYQITYHYGTLNIQPRPLTIATGSAEKAYNGEPLICNEYTILSGSLCPQDELHLNCTALWGIGYSDNYVTSCFIIRTENGVQIDVTNYYRITFQYGVLRINAS